MESIRTRPMKKLLIAVIIILVAGLTLPKFIGSIVETEHQAILDDINTNEMISVDAKNFTANWFDGKAVTEMSINLAEADLPDLTFTIEEDILFGPFIFADDGFHFGLSHSTAKVNLKELGLDDEIADFINDKITVTSLLTFSKDMVSRITLDAINKEVDDNHLNISPAVAEFKLSDKKHLVASFDWQGMSIKNNEANITVGEVTATTDQTLISGDYYSNNAISVGTGDFVVSSVKAEDLDGNPILNVANAFIKVKSSEKEDMLKVELTYHVDEATSMGQTFEHANLDLVFENLDVQAIQELNEILADFSGEEELSPEEIEKLMALGSKMIEKNPVLKVTDLSVSAAEGKFVSDMMVSIDKDKYDPANPMSIMMAAKAEAKAEAPEALFIKFGLGQMIDMYIEQGLLIRTDDKLSFSTTYSDAQLQVNGQVIPM